MAELIQAGPLQIRFLRSKHDSGGALDLFEVVVPPNARVPVPHHHRDWEETIYGLEGVMTWTVSGQRIDVGPGEELFIPRGIIHGFANETQAVTKMLCILTPGILGPEYFRDMATLVNGPAAPDPVKIRETMLLHGLVPVPAPDRGSAQRQTDDYSRQ